jgi:hypothetical protein
MTCRFVFCISLIIGGCRSPLHHETSLRHQGECATDQASICKVSEVYLAINDQPGSWITVNSIHAKWPELLTWKFLSFKNGQVGKNVSEPFVATVSKYKKSGGVFACSGKLPLSLVAMGDRYALSNGIGLFSRVSDNATLPQLFKTRQEAIEFIACIAVLDPYRGALGIICVEELSDNT